MVSSLQSVVPRALTNRIKGLLSGLVTDDPITPIAEPNWSGLDARDFSGAVPAPGTVIESVPLHPSLWVSAASAAYRFLYATTNAHGPAAVSTAAVFLPAGDPPADGWPVVALAHGTVGLGDDATPSAQPRSERHEFYLAHWLRRGYAVVATDYAGLGTPGLMSYLNGKVEARNLIDSVAAAHHLVLPLSRTWALVGHSQGAGAAINGARYARDFGSHYNLDFRGVVATGTPANIERIAQFFGPSFPPVPLPAATTTYAAYILAALIDARPDLGVDAVLTDEGSAVINDAQTLSLDAMRTRVRGEQVTSWLRRPLRSVPNLYPALRDHLAIPASGFDQPIFLGHGLTDVDVPILSGLSLAAALRINRQPVTVRVYPTDHFGTVYAVADDAANFLESVMR